jgi:DNA polymerase-1
MDALPQALVSDDTIARLLRLAIDAGAWFRLSGAQVVALNGQRAAPQVMRQLRERRDALWDYLGGPALDAPSLDLMAGRFKHVQITVPQTEAEALTLIAKIEDDADRQTERYVKGVLSLDIETQANAEEEVCQFVCVNQDGSVHQPSHRALDPEHLRRKGKPGSTAGLDPNRSSVRLAQLYGGGRTCLVLDTRIVPLQALAPVLSRRRLIIHNAGFELRFLHHAGIMMPRLECLMQAAGLMLGVNQRGLDDTAQQYLGIKLPKELQLSDWGADVLSPGQIAYAALDAIIAWQLWPHVLGDVLKAGRGRAYLVCRDVIPPVVRMQARGVLMDTAAHRQQVQRWHDERTAAEQAYQTLRQEPPPSTPAEIRALLEDVLSPKALHAWPRSEKKKLLTTAGKQLLKHASSVPALAQLCTIKTYEKLLSSFGDTLAACVARDGRIHARFNIAAAKTGRMSCSDPNLQQLPRDTRFRDCFVAGEGNLLVVADYVTMELRAGAETSNDTVMRRDFEMGVDLHENLARQIHGIPAGQPVPKELRQGSKPINFGSLYGAGAPRLAQSAWEGYGIVMTVSEAERARAAFFARYRIHLRWMHDHADICQRRGFIDAGRFGRVIMAEWEAAPKQEAPHGYSRYGYGDDDDDNNDDDLDSDDEDGLDALGPYGRNYPARSQSPLRYTLCNNAPIQGACAEIIMRAIAFADHALTDAGIPFGLILVVHDELVAEVPEHYAAQAAELLRVAMEQAFHEYFPDAPLDGLVIVHTGKSWGEAKG